MIKIGISACFMYPDPKRKVFAPKTLLYMGHDMSHFLGLNGIMPILIPDLPDESMFYTFLKQMDGFIFQGGVDISPENYGEEPKNFNFAGDPGRDIYEFKILDYAIKEEKPVLGICRGMQLLNVFFGGSLYQDLRTCNPKASCHNDEQLYDEHVHDIEFISGSLFEKVYGSQQCMKVNSVHHQGIKKLAKNLLVEAVCPEDKIIEAVSMTKDGKTSYKQGLVTGIQWHPEFFHTMDADTIDPKPVLDNFIYLCRNIAGHY